MTSEEPMAHTSDIALLRRLRRLHTALLSDVLDTMDVGVVFLGGEVRPLHPSMRLAGRALTMRTEAVTAPLDPPYREMIAGFARIRVGDVVLLAGDAGSPAGMWGELLSVAARARGAEGAVTDGLCRDVEQIEELGFPVFARGASPLDSSGRQEVVEVGSPVPVAGGMVSPGDYLLADRMGVIAFPAGSAEEAVTRAEEKDRGESTVRAELEAGEDMGAVFARHGIL